MKHVAIIPLIGGFSIAATNVLGKQPEAIFSYTPFFDNDSLYLNYLGNKAPKYHQIDKEGYTDYTDIDIVHGIPPCSGLSNCSSFKSGVRATACQNDWMYKSAEFVMKKLKPKVFVFENAPGLFTNVGEPVRQNLKEIAERLGYAGTFYKTNTIYHGVPQNRPRTYTVMVQGDKAPLLSYFDKPLPTILEYLKSIPKDATLQDKYSAREPYIDDYEIVKFLKQKYGDNWRQEFLNDKTHLTSYDFLHGRKLLEEFLAFAESQPVKNEMVIKDIKHVINKKSQGLNFRISYRVLCIDKNYIYAVISEMMERNIHPVENRRYNMREYMHFMGLPHDFQIDNPDDYRKITQNVPVTTSEDIIREVVKIVEGNGRFSNKRFEMQDNTKKEDKIQQPKKEKIEVKPKTKSLF